MSTVFGSTAAGVIILILIVLVIALLGVMFNLNLRMNRLQKRYRLFMKGADGQSVEKAVAGRLIELGKLQHGQEQTHRDIDTLQHQYDRMLCKYGIVKYDAFEDVGGKMSFALAMLDQDNTGFVLNAIHSRDNCFLYLKDVVKGTSYIMLSDEEIEALRRAARYGEDNALADAAAKKAPAKPKATKKAAQAATESGPAAPAAATEERHARAEATAPQAATAASQEVEQAEERIETVASHEDIAAEETTFDRMAAHRREISAEERELEELEAIIARVQAEKAAAQGDVTEQTVVPEEATPDTAPEE